MRIPDFSHVNAHGEYRPLLLPETNPNWLSSAARLGNPL